MNKKLFSQKQKRLLSLSGFAHLVHDGFTDTLFILFPIWANTFGLVYTEIGALKMVASSVLSIFQIPAGMLSEKFGERSILAIGTILAALGFVLLYFVSGFLGLALCLALIGLGASTQHPLASTLVSKGFSKNKRTALGIYNFAGDIGKAIFPLSVSTISVTFSWLTGTFTVGIFGIAAGVVIYIGFYHLGLGEPQKLQKKIISKKISGWAITDMMGFSCLSAISMIDTSVRLAFLTYLPFLLTEKGADLSTLGIALTLVFAGGAAGKLICGIAAERFGIIKTMATTEIATASGLIILIFVPLLPAMMFLPFLGLVLNGTSSVLYGCVGDFVDEKQQARAFGLFYTLAIGAGAISPFLYGLISDGLGLNFCFITLATSLIFVIPLFLPLSKRLAEV
uniref:77 permeases of the major facilitator superfamily n=2 Tax=environmental samples TaxID=48479 RepID=E0XTN6_9BACT|nr:77 permeases of the major facilitator superfamily [uncultured nuHF1 cluster bacterium HF0130_31E21]ADI21820.1 permeases of the major facilitator superfamily [uncultured nuHF1 cluster bacterium HF0130_24M16]